MSKLPPEALKFAKSMGLSLDGLEPEAEDMWKMLNDMSNSDPLKYQEFVRQQMEEMKLQEEEEKTGKAKTDDGTRSLRPAAGFCVQTETFAGDGIKIREYDLKRSRQKGKPFFLNICESQGIECPSANGVAVTDPRRIPDGLSIPLIVGTARDLEDPSSAEGNDSNDSCSSENLSIALDVLVNPKVIEMARYNSEFKGQVVQLALDWVMEESELKMYPDWTALKVRKSVEAIA
jgi:hypothetical protein